MFWRFTVLLIFKEQQLMKGASVFQWLEFLATDPEVRVRFPELPHFLRNIVSGRGPLSLVSTIEELHERKVVVQVSKTGHNFADKWR
jgi:hypothetical protein